jgi:V/A-type H+-transporting ATPase subunit A
VVAQNEICYILKDEVKLMAEVIRIGKELAYVQVFESTRGLKPGMPVEFTGHMLEATLGPGLLSKISTGCKTTSTK